MNNSKKVEKLKKNWKAKKENGSWQWGGEVGVEDEGKKKKNESTLFIEIKTSR